MKKTLLSVIAGLAVIGSANAGIKETCLEHPDKLVWVEKTQRCIPINPCKSDDEKIKAMYCVRRFRDVQTRGDLYKGLIELYAETYNVDCAPVEQEAKLIGQDYVLCKGSNVRVFEFDDIHNSSPFTFPDYEKLATALCSSVNGYFDSEKNGCLGIGDLVCGRLNKVIRKYPVETHKMKNRKNKNTEWGLYGAHYNGEWCAFDTIAQVPEHQPTLGELDPGYDSSEGHFSGF